MKKTLRLGLIGSGFMGKTHVFGFAAAARVFDLPYEVELTAIADVTMAQAEAARAALGFRRATDDWRSLVADPDIDLIDITAPNALHKTFGLRRDPPHFGSDRVLPRSDHHGGGVGLGVGNCGEHMRQQGLAGDRMQHFRLCRAHAGALAGCEHDGKAAPMLHPHEISAAPS